MVDQIIGDVKLMRILDKYSGVFGDKKKTASAVIANLAGGIKNPEFIVPVLGSQGVGKSTLINAILGVDVLPSDADETTCVPVEIRYGKSEKAVVYFQSGEKTNLALSSDALREFVDNNENAGNEKRVSHIALEIPSKLLHGGLVIVDLPGVGSLTKNNQDVTMRYISKLCTAIFVIPTVPTIRRNEEVFIRGAWGTFSSAIFVQNRWDDEMDEEVEDSVAFNTKVLQSIAKKNNAIYNGKICVVNAYQAIVGRIRKDARMCEQSNLPELLAELEHFSSNRAISETAGFIAKVKSLIETAQVNIRQALKESQMTEAQRRAEKARILADFEATTTELQEQINGILEFINAEREKSQTFICQIATHATESVRADVRKLIDGGVVDGDLLTEAFKDYQEKYQADAIEQIYDYIQTFKHEFEKKCVDLVDKINNERASSFAAFQFHNGQAFKWEKGLDVGGSLVGLGLAFIVPGGWFVGLGITMLCGLIGRFAKNKIVANRAYQAKREIEPLVEKFGATLNETLRGYTNGIMDDVTEVLKSYLNDRRAKAYDRRKQQEQESDEVYRAKYDVAELNEHYAYLENRKGALR